MGKANIEELRKECRYICALAGNPNVGKSTVFNSLTSECVDTANYPGKTVSLNIARTMIDDIEVGLVDLPGTYSLGAVTEDQWVAREALIDCGFDSVIYIADATNIKRNLYMLLQLIDLGYPLVAALNLTDEAHRRGIYIDKHKLSNMLGIDIIETVATRGVGLKKLVGAAVSTAKYRDKPSRKISYGKEVEEFINEIFSVIKTSKDKIDIPLDAFGCAVLLFEKDDRIVNIIKKNPEVYEKIEKIWQNAEKKFGKDTRLILADERNKLAEDIVEECQIISIQYHYKESRLFNFITSPVWGTAVLFLVFISVFGILYYIGPVLSGWIDCFWAAFIYTPMKTFFLGVFGAFWGEILNSAFNEGILASLTIGIPYVFLFYFILGFLEDTGYLNVMAFLVDKIMHKFGLHGRASIMLVAGFGCNVPAIMGVKVLNSMREKFIASFLITLIPCSARVAVIMGAVAFFLGPLWALSVFAVSFLLIAVSGYFLNKILKGSALGLVMEVSDLRMPVLRIVLLKTWQRFRDFVFVAMPIIIIGSIILGLIYETGLIWQFAKPFKFVIEDMLGLPAVAGLTLIFAVIRKELALIFLVTLAVNQYGESARASLLSFMTKQQIYIFVLVNTIYIPCLATIAVLFKEIGLKRTAYITIFTVIMAILAGVAARFVISYFALLG
ncbi:MAG: ferrous iron transport protein B [Armatimonadota bacterium]